MRFSLILATLGRTLEVEALLASLSEQTYKNFHVIIVDQNDDDRLQFFVDKYSDIFEILHVRSKKGLSRARNVGLAIADGDVIAFPDDDCVYPPGLLAAAAGSLAYAHIDGISGRTLPIGAIVAPNPADPKFKLTKLNVWHHAISYTIFLKRGVVDRVGQFDETLGVGAGTPWGAGEETDYLLRAIGSGFDVYFDPAISVTHPEKDLATPDGVRRARLYAQGIGRVLAKHGTISTSAAWSLFRSFAGLILSFLSLDVMKIRLAHAKFAGKVFGLRQNILRPEEKGPALKLSEVGNGSDVDICMFIPNLNGGGAERVMLVIAQEFVHMGYKVDFVVTKHWGKLKDQVPDGVRYISLDHKRVLYSVFSYIKYLRVAKPRTVISSLENANIVSCVSKLLSGHSHNLTIRIENSFVESGSIWNQRSRWFWLALIALTFRFADSFICISRGIERQLKFVPGCSNKPAFQISNPVITRDFESRLNAPDPFSPRKDRVPYRIVAVGRLHRQKDYPTLLRAFAICSSALSCELHILGEGDELDTLRSLSVELKIADSVVFHGFVPNPIQYLAHADLFVLSSAWEGFGNVVVEALAAGVPVVSTDCPHGPAEILEQGRFGRLVAVGDAEALSSAIIATLTEKIDRFTADELSAHLDEYECRAIAKSYSEVLGLLDS